MDWNASAWRAPLTALLAGAVLPLAFAPLNGFALAYLSAALFFWLCFAQPPRRALWLGLLFGIGQFGGGVSWIYVAVHDFGFTGVPLAVLLTALMVLALALFPALLAWGGARLWERFGARMGRTLWLLALMPALWTLGEWVRGWFLTGFPWLNLGYSQIDTPLAGFAPVWGVYGLSYLTALIGALLLQLYWGRRRAWPALLPLAALFLGGGLLAQHSWSEPLGRPLRVALVQGNLPQITKWDSEMIKQRLDTYARLTLEQLEEHDLIMWPENAVTVFYHQLKDDYFAWLDERSRESDTALVVGLPIRHPLDEERYYTSLMAFGKGSGVYHKHHLVPFGEYVPLEGLLRGLIAFFDLPMTGFVPGPERQPLLELAGYRAAASICYEDAFGEAIIRALPEAQLLINGSNNAWYGDSLAPHQHLQIARMRALETGRAVVRATTNGISALIGPDGRVRARSAQFKTEVLSGRVQPMQGATPYVRVGNYAVLAFLWLAIAGAFWPLLRRRRPAA